MFTVPFVCMYMFVHGSHIITKKLLLTATVKFYVLLKELGSSGSEHIKELWNMLVFKNASKA